MSAIVEAKVVQVIRTESAVGRGVPGDPVRVKFMYWSFEGELLAEMDPLERVPR